MIIKSNQSAFPEYEKHHLPDLNYGEQFQVKYLFCVILGFMKANEELEIYLAGINSTASR